MSSLTEIIYLCYHLRKTVNKYRFKCLINLLNINSLYVDVTFNFDSDKTPDNVLFIDLLCRLTNQMWVCYSVRVDVRCRLPCSPPRAAHSHSSSVGSLWPFHLQNSCASFQLTWTTGKSKRSRILEPGPAGWAEARRSEAWGIPSAGKKNVKLTCLQKARSTGSHQGAD